MKLVPDVQFQSQLQDNPWQQLKAYTDARIALGRPGRWQFTNPTKSGVSAGTCSSQRCCA